MRIRLLAALLISTLPLLAADVTGNWKATAEGPNGTMERTFALKAEGAKLTGETVSTFLGKSEIKDGKIDGANLSFVIDAKFQDNDMRVKYTGKVVGDDEIKFTADVNGQTMEWTAKRVK